MDCSFARPVDITCSDLVTEKSLAEAREGELRSSLLSQEMDCHLLDLLIFPV